MYHLDVLPLVGVDFDVTGLEYSSAVDGIKSVPECLVL